MKTTRKMQMFWGTLFFLFFVFIYSYATSIQFTGDNIQNIIVVFFIFVTLMAGANVGEHFSKAIIEKAKNGSSPTGEKV